MKNKLLSFLMLTLVLSCAEKGGDNDKEVTNLDDFRTYAIDVESKAIPIFDLIEEVEIMRLEETEESLLGGVFQMYSAGDKFIFPNSTDKGIYTFSKNGEFLGKFSHKGSGPGEYEFVQSFWVEKDTIFLYDINKRRLLSYNLAGDHLKTWKINFHATSFYSYGKGFVANLDDIPFQDSLKFNVLFMDENMEVVHMDNPYNARLNLSFMMTTNKFKSYQDGLIFHQDKSDKVYFIENGESNPMMRFDFGEKWLWTEETIKNNPRASSLIRETDMVWFVSSYISERWIYLTYQTSFEDKFNALIDRNSGVQRAVKVNKDAATKYTMTPIKWEEDRFMVSLQSPDVREFINDLGEEKVRFREGTTLEEIESSENPVLMWVKFK